MGQQGVAGPRECDAGPRERALECATGPRESVAGPWENADGPRENALECAAGLGRTPWRVLLGLGRTPWRVLLGLGRTQLGLGGAMDLPWAWRPKGGPPPSW